MIASRLRQVGLLQRQLTFSFPIPSTDQINPGACPRIRMSRSVNVAEPTQTVSWANEAILAAEVLRNAFSQRPKSIFATIVEQVCKEVFGDTSICILISRQLAKLKEAAEARRSRDFFNQQVPLKLDVKLLKMELPATAIKTTMLKIMQMLEQHHKLVEIRTLVLEMLAMVKQIRTQMPASLEMLAEDRIFKMELEPMAD